MHFVAKSQSGGVLKSTDSHIRGANKFLHNFYIFRSENQKQFMSNMQAMKTLP